MRLDEANFVNDAENVYYLDDDLDSAMNTVDETQIPRAMKNMVRCSLKIKMTWKMKCSTSI